MAELITRKALVSEYDGIDPDAEQEAKIAEKISLAQRHGLNYAKLYLNYNGGYDMEKLKSTLKKIKEEQELGLAESPLEFLTEKRVDSLREALKGRLSKINDPDAEGEGEEEEEEVEDDDEDAAKVKDPSQLKDEAMKAIEEMTLDGTDEEEI